MTAVTEILRTMDYGLAPEANDHVARLARKARRPLRRISSAASSSRPREGELFRRRQSGARQPPRRMRRRQREGRRRGRRGGAQGLQVVVGALRRRARPPPLRHRPHPQEARALLLRAGDDGQRQADPREPRHRHPAGRPPLLSSRRLGGADRQRVSGLSAGRRLRPDHPVEFSAADAGLEDRAGARRRQHGGAEAGRVHAADRARLRRDLPRGGPAARRRQHRHRRRRDRRG